MRRALRYFWSEHRWTAIGLLAAIIVLTLAGVYLNIVYTYWYKIAYNALQTKNAGVFWASMFTYRTVKGFPYFVPGFAEIAALTIVAAVYAVYLNQMLQIRWRRWLTENLVNGWLDRRAYYRIILSAKQGTALDNPDQRISDDAAAIVSSNLSLGISIISNVASLVGFVGVLWTIGPPLAVHGVVIHGYLVWVALIYSAAGTFLTHLIGRKLVPLTFQQQRVEADFRFDLIQVRENSEQIALYRGEKQEKSGLRNRFAGIYLNWWKIMKRTKVLNFFTNGFAQVAVVFPILVAAPDYFSGVFTLGVMMQIAAIFGNVQSSFSWFVNSYPDLVAWRATAQRLQTFDQAIDDAHRSADSSDITIENGASELRVENLAAALPDGKVLLEQDRLELRPGDPIAIEGASGVGKSTLLRVLAGIWPFARGRVALPSGTMMFLPQRSYLPLGSLKDTIAYPTAGGAISDESVRAAMQNVGLTELGAHLHEVDNWRLRLSGGEQQRIALARALVARPDWLFMDEALSGLDETQAASLFERIRKLLPRTQIVSITHQESLADLHPRLAAMRGSPAHLVVLTDPARRLDVIG